MNQPASNSGAASCLVVLVIAVFMGGSFLALSAGAGAYLYLAAENTPSPIRRPMTNPQSNQPVFVRPPAGVRPAVTVRPTRRVNPPRRNNTPPPRPEIQEDDFRIDTVPFAKNDDWQPGRAWSNVDLGRHANMHISQLQGLPVKPFKVDGVSFAGQHGAVGVASKVVYDRQHVVKGIEINAAYSRLYFAHASTGGAYPTPGHPKHEVESQQIGEYVIHYADRKFTTIPIIYGETMRDWWAWDGDTTASNGKRVEGDANERATSRKIGTRFFVSMWVNPRPDQRIHSIDMRTSRANAAPFCFAITGTTDK